MPRSYRKPAAPACKAGGLLQRWDARYKLVGLGALIFSFAMVRELRLLPVMLGSTVAIFGLSSLGCSYLFARLRLPGIFLLPLGLLLPFWSGQTVLAQLGPFSLRLEGCLELSLIAAKFLSMLTVGIALFASTPLPELGSAMRSLRVPSLLVDMLLFTHRYIYQLSADLNRAGSAARLRGFNGRSLFSVKTPAFMVGSLLIRSNDQAERVFQAMSLRGYGLERAPADTWRAGTGDRLGLASSLLLAAALAAASLR